MNGEKILHRKIARRAYISIETKMHYESGLKGESSFASLWFTHTLKLFFKGVREGIAVEHWHVGACN
jgi:hypothetical protein